MILHFAYSFYELKAHAYTLWETFKLGCWHKCFNIFILKIIEKLRFRGWVELSPWDKFKNIKVVFTTSEKKNSFVLKVLTNYFEEYIPLNEKGCNYILYFLNLFEYSAMKPKLKGNEIKFNISLQILEQENLFSMNKFTSCGHILTLEYVSWYFRCNI